MSDAQRWLDARPRPLPSPLREAVRVAVERTSAGTDLPSRLAMAALDLLRSVARGPTDRRVALDLLAADALLTAACEAAAERGPQDVARLVSELDLPRFASVLAPDDS